MIIIKLKLALVLGAAGAIALSVTAAEARTKRAAPNVQTDARGADVGNPFAFPSSYRGSFNAYDAPGNGINFRDGRNGANYNPNQ